MRFTRPFQRLTSRVTEDPLSTLWHTVCGHMLGWSGPVGGPVSWGRTTHRGVQWLDKIEFPRKQKRYIFSPLFDVRYDTAFEQTILGCANAKRDVPTWISDAYRRSMIELHRMGYAHSFEAWHKGELVGGGFGIQLGSMMTFDSMFHLMNNASKAAYGQTLIRLRQRGFVVLDTNGVATHQVNYGEEWMQEWQFQRLIFDCLRDWPTLTDQRPYPRRLPVELRCMIPVLRAQRAVLRRLPLRRATNRQATQDAQPAQPPSATEVNPAPH